MAQTHCRKERTVKNHWLKLSKNHADGHHGTQPGDEASDQVSLMTLHAAKDWSFRSFLIA